MSGRIDVRAPRKVASSDQARPDRPIWAALSYDGHSSQTSRRTGEAGRRAPEEPVPTIRPFRALRYEAEAVGDLALVDEPAVRRDRPGRAAGAARPASAQRRPPRPAGRGARRRAGRQVPPGGPDLRGLALRRHVPQGPRPAVYVYDQTYRLPGVDSEVSQRGFFARVRLEPFGEGGILPHERTLATPREDRYRLLRATGANMSPVAMLYDDPSGRTTALLARDRRRARLHARRRRDRRGPCPASAVGRAGRGGTGR